MIKRGFELVIWPAELTVQTAKRVGSAAVRSVHSPRLGSFRAEHHYEDQIEILMEESDRIRDDDELARMCAVRVLNLTTQHYKETKAGSEPMSEAYVDQVTQIMQDCGVPFATIAEIMDNPVTLEDIAGRQHNPTS